MNMPDKIKFGLLLSLLEHHDFPFEDHAGTFTTFRSP